MTSSRGFTRLKQGVNSSFIRPHVFLFSFLSCAGNPIARPPRKELALAIPWKHVRTSLLTFFPTLSQLESPPSPSQINIPKAQFPPQCFSDSKSPWFISQWVQNKVFHVDFQRNLEISQHSTLKHCVLQLHCVTHSIQSCPALFSLCTCLLFCLPKCYHLAKLS